MTDDELLVRLKQIAFENQSHMSIDYADDKSYVDVEIENDRIDLSVTISKIGEGYYAYGLESTHLPRELYSDNVENGYSNMQRSNEILSNVNILLSGKVKALSKKSFFGRHHSFIELEVDGKKSRVPYYDESN